MYVRKWGSKDIKYSWKWPHFFNGWYAWEIDFGKFSLLLRHRGR